RLNRGVAEGSTRTTMLGGIMVAAPFHVKGVAKSGTETELTAAVQRIRRVTAVNSVSVPDFATPTLTTKNVVSAKKSDNIVVIVFSRTRVSTHFAVGSHVARTASMKRVIALLTILGITSCAHKVEVRAPEFVRAERYWYVKDEKGRVYIVT